MPEAVIVSALRSPLGSKMTIDELIAAARNGSTRAAGRLLSLVESPRRDEVLDALGDDTPCPRRRRDRPAGRGQVDDGRRAGRRLPRTRVAGGGARRRSVVAVQRRSAARRPDPDGRPHQRPRRADPLGGDPRPSRRSGRRGARRHPAAGRAVLRPDRARDGRRRAVRDRDRRGRRPDHRRSSIPVRATRFRPPRRACSRSPTSSW